MNFLLLLLNVRISDTLDRIQYLVRKLFKLVDQSVDSELCIFSPLFASFIKLTRVLWINFFFFRKHQFRDKAKDAGLKKRRKRSKGKEKTQVASKNISQTICCSVEQK